MKDSLLDGCHAVIRPCVPSPQSHGTLGWHSLPKIPLTVGQGQVLEPPEQPNFHGNKVTILSNGTLALMVETTSLMVKQKPVGAPSPADLDGRLNVCVARLLPLRRSLRMLRLYSIPTPPQNLRV